MRKFGIKKFIAVIAASAMTLAMTACGNTGNGDEKNTELKKVVIGLPISSGIATESAGIAQLEGFLEEELGKAGYELEIQGFALAGPAINEAFASGAVDFSVYGDQPAITAAANGIDVKIIASVNNYLEHALLISNDITFDSLEDLKGKRIVVGFGTPIHRYILALLERAGLTVDDVELINSNTDGPTLIASGDADIVAQVQAAVRSFEAQGIGWYYETPLKQNDLSQVFILAGSESSMQKYPGSAEAIIKALDDAYELAKENPEKAYVDLAQSSFPDAINRLIYSDTSFPEFDPVITDDMIDHLQVSVDFMKDHKLINSDITAQDVVDTSYVKKALAE